MKQKLYMKDLNIHQLLLLVCYNTFTLSSVGIVLVTEDIFGLFLG